jgi:hypothetical protein
VSDRRNPQQPDRRRTLARPGGRRASDPPAEWITIAAYAVRYGVNRHIVYKWLAAHLLDIYEVGSLLRIRNLPRTNTPPQRKINYPPSVRLRAPLKSRRQTVRNLCHSA